MTTKRTSSLLFAAVLGVLGCTDQGPVEDGAIGEIALGVAPAGSDAAFVNHNVPLAMNPGERLNVRVIMQNTGAASPANDWTTAYQLRRNPNVANPFTFVSDPVIGTIPAVPSTATDFDFIVTAPTVPGTYTFDTRMYSAITGSAGYFGEAVSIVNIDVDPGVQRRWACSFEAGLSTLPATMLATEARTVTVTVRNTGTEPWLAGPSLSCLRSRDDQWSGNLYFWTPTFCPRLNVDVPPGSTASFTFDIVAPAADGTYPFQRQMFQSGQPTPTGGVGYFDLFNHCVNTTIDVQPSQPFRDASVVADDFPTQFAPSEPRIVRLTMQNDGLETWVPGDFALTSRTSPSSLWGATIANLNANVVTGAQNEFVIVLRAPATPQASDQLWQMTKLASPGVGPFGELVTRPGVVDATTPPTYTAQLVGQTIPTRVTAGSVVSFSITMRNTGLDDWDHSFFQLRSRTTPTTLWGTLSAGLLVGETVAVGADRVFTFNVTAPAAPGVYESRWAMALAGGPAYFFLSSDEATQNVEVTLCGNGVIDPGETCDDGNLLDGDLCSSRCGFTIDLATDQVDRTLIGSSGIKQLANVAIGDINGDGVNDVVVGEMAHVYPPGQSGRSRAGRVHAFLGGPGFFSATRDQVPSNGVLDIWGADNNDRFGGSSHAGIVIADVTGDGIDDLIVSTNFGDGVGNARVDCGEVFVFRGGAALGVGGIVDLAQEPLSPLIAARIIGPTAGAGLIVLRAADLTGDGIADLVLGSTADGTTATGAGRVSIVAGGASLTGVVDLAVTPPIASVYGIGAGDSLGHAASVGDVSGDGILDLLVGASLHDPGGVNNGGGVWAIFGPVVGDYQLALGAFDVAWVGGLNEKYGGSLAIANVTGNASPELLVGSSQTRDTGGVQVGSVDVWGAPFAAGTTFDLGTGLLPDTRVTGPDYGDNTGRCLAVGDMDGDGYDEIPVIMSAADGPLNGRTNSGELGIVRGRATLPAFQELGIMPPDILVYGALAYDYLGNHPNDLAMGDIDGDGLADLCVGSPNGGTDVTIDVPGRVDCIASPY